MIEQCAVLIGGRGSRLGDIVRHTPKPMLQVAGVPFVVHVMLALSAYGVQHFLLLAGYRAEVVESFFLAPCSKLTLRKIKVEVLTESSPLGTAGALKAAHGRLAESFLLCNGDSYCDFDITPLCLPFRYAETLCRMALCPMPRDSRYGAVSVEEDSRIATFRERSANPASGLMNAGVYCMRKAFVDAIPSGPSSLEAEIFPSLAAQGKLESLILPPSFFIDIGVPEDLEKAQKIFSSTNKPGVLTETGTQP